MNTPITFADLFAGIGGFRLGIENAAKRLGIPVECVFSSEIEKNARLIYERSFHTTPAGDITKIHTDDIGDMDILCGGFPCQSFSIAGHRRGFEDTRGTLFFEIARIARAKRPKILFLENVKGLLNHDRGRTFGQILLTLDELGYDAEWQVLNSKDFGVPQNRERVFIIGHSRRYRSGQIFPVTGTTTATTRENSSTCIDANYGKGIDNHGARTGIISYPVMTPERLEKRANGRRMKNAEEPMFTLTAQDRHGVLIQHYCGTHQADRVIEPDGISSCLSTCSGGDLIPKILLSQKSELKFSDITERKKDYLGRNMPIHRGKKLPEINGRIRRLTPLECERLQSFPDNYTAGIADSNRYRCLGNAVTVNVIKAIAEKLLIELNRGF